GHQTSRFRVLAEGMHRRQSTTERQRIDANPVGVHKPVGSDIKCVRAALESLESGPDILYSPNLDHVDHKPKRGRLLEPAAFRQRRRDCPYWPRLPTGRGVARPRATVPLV